MTDAGSTTGICKLKEVTDEQNSITVIQRTTRDDKA